MIRAMKDLVRFEIPNDFQSTRMANYISWYGEGETDSRCCHGILRE
jgi:hypothetical protein